MGALTLAPLERSSSACQRLNVDPAWWESDDPVDVARAVAACHRCWYEQECLIWALKAHPEGQAVYGGFWFLPPPNWRERRRVHRGARLMSDTPYELNRKVAQHLWTAHGAAATAKMIDGPEHLHRACPGLIENHRLEHLAVVQGELRPSWRQHDHDAELEP